MRNFYILITALFISTNCFAQKEVTLQVIYKPGKVYSTTTQTTAHGLMDFTGDEALIQKIKDSGTSLPMTIESKNEMQMTSTTGTHKADKTLPFKIQYNKATTTQSINGKSQTTEMPLTGLIIEGHYVEDKTLVIDTIISESVNETIKKAMADMLKNAQSQIAFPDRPLKKGDTFDQELPLSIPMAGNNSAKIVVKTKYTVTDIRDKKVFLGLVQKATLDMSVEQANIEAAGDGTGVSEYDITNHTISKYESTLSMDMKMTMNTLIMTAKLKTITSMTITVK